MKKLPYGISNFKRIVNENCYYVDKTRYIHDMEDFASYLFLIRPRRFGKSLFIDMLCAYYDILEKDNFNQYFGDLWIGKHPTENANRYLVMRFDFSRAAGPTEELEQKFNDYLCSELNTFIKNYAVFFDEWTVNSVLSTDSASNKLNIIGAEARAHGLPLYLIVDEYDNFTNVVLAKEGKEKFHALTHAEGFYRSYFKIFKAIFHRVFLIGVSPVTLDDVTSGYNIDWNITLEERFNDVLGFTEEDVRGMLTYYKSEGALGPGAIVEEMIEEMRPWYDNYCFSEDAIGEPSLYNCDMVLYYINSWMKTGRGPKEMADKNIRTDYSKLKMLVDIDRGQGVGQRLDVIRNIANTGSEWMPLVSSFPAMEITDISNFRSLLYYYGMLTIRGRRGTLLHMEIPNQCVREQYWAYLFSLLKKEYNIDNTPIVKDFVPMAFDGVWEPAIRFIADTYTRVSSVRDTIGGEHNVQGFFKAFLSVSDYHILCPEIELGYGYSDFLMAADTRRFPEAVHSYVIELKYARTGAPDSAVDSLLAEAAGQVERYAADHRLLRFCRGTTLHGLVVVVRGHEAAVITQTLEKHC